jgi:hypothetical protein
MKQKFGNIIEVPFSPQPVFDFDPHRGAEDSLGIFRHWHTARILLTGDMESAALKNMPIGEPLVLLFVQDAAGGHRYAWPEGLGGGEVMETRPHSITSQAFIFDGRCDKTGNCKGIVRLGPVMVTLRESA